MPKKKIRTKQPPKPSRKPALKLRRQTEKALRESEAQFRAALQSTADGILAVDSKGKVLQANQRFVELWRIPQTLMERKDDRVLLDFVLDQLIDPDAFLKKVNLLYNSDAEDMDILIFKDGRVFERYSRPMILGGTVSGRVWSFRNITERKRTDEALRESEERYHRIVTTLTDYIFTSYLENGRVVKTVHGPGCIAVTGYSAEEFIADPYLWFNMVHPEDRDRVKDHASRILSVKDPSSIEHRIRRKDGNVRWVSNTPVPYHDSSGALVRYDGLIRDITERKQAEEALRESEERWRTIVTYEPECVKLFDREGRVLEMNPAGLAMIQATFDQVRGKKAVGVVAEKDKSAFNEMVEAVFRGETRHLVYDIIGLKGRRLTLETTSVPLRETGPAGDVKALLGVTRDITDRKRTEDQLRKLSLAVEQSPATIVITDTHGNIEYVNPKFTQITGYTMGEALGKNPRILKSGEMSAEGYKTLWENITSGKEWRGEFHNKKKNGDLYWETASISPVKDKDNVITHFIAVKEDITERRKAESEIRLLAQTLASTKDCISIADFEDKIIFVNDAFLQTYRYTREELIGRPISVVRLVNASPEVGSQILAGTLAGGWYGELLNCRKDGSEFPIELWTSVVKDESGKVVATVGVARDITERKHAEKTLQESEEKFRSVWEKSNDGMRITNEAGDVISVNDAFCKMMEKPRAEIEGKPMSVVYEQARKIEILNKHRERFRSRSIPPHIERTITLWNGEKKSLELSNTFLRIADQPIVSLSIFRDVTDRKQAEEALRTSTAKLETLVQVSPLAIMLLDSDGNVQLWNTAAEQIFGWRSEKVIGHPNPIVPLGKQDEYNTLSAQISTGKPITNLETVRQRKDGTFIDVSISSAPIYDAAGNVAGRMAIVADITLRKHMEGEREKLILELQEALANIKTLSGLIPICASCKKIRDDKGYWNQLEKYIIEHSGAKFTHGLCPECAEKFRSEFKKEKNDLSKK